MQAKNATRVDLWTALARAGRSFDGNLAFGRKPEPVGSEGSGWLAFTLEPRDPHGPGVTRSKSGPVCCDHAHKAFFRALFSLARYPERVVVSTSRITYKGRSQFEKLAPAMDRGGRCTCKPSEV